MNPKGSATNLIQAVKELNLHWQLTRNSWHDTKSEEFERTYLEEIPDQVGRAAHIFAEIEELLGKVRRDCE